MTFRSSLLPIVLALAPTLSSGFVTPHSAPCIPKPSPSSLSATSTSRRNFIEQTIAAAATTSVLISSPLPAFAKEKEELIITKETVTAAFDAIRFELNDSTGVVSKLANLIENGSFEDIIEYTREQDAYFRKAKIGKARKLLMDKDMKGASLQDSNAVTWDLIGINRASRPGKENKEEQLKYWEELKKDIAKFLEYESAIVIPE